ncbi:MAG: electron transport complex subunit RsxC [Gammaproteobacteria bacterium]
MLEYLPKRRRVGGLRIDPHKSDSTSKPIEEGFIPDRLFIPVEPHRGTTPRCLVHRGQHVLRGQKLAIGQPGSGIADVHASSSGQVAEVIELEQQTTSGPTRISCIVIDTDGRDECMPASIAADSNSATRPELLELVRESGIVGLGGAAVSTSWKLDRSDSLRTLIINGAECEPYISCDDMLMREEASGILAGSLDICNIIEAERCIVAIERDKPRAIAAIREAAKDFDDPRLNLAELPSIYPAGGECQLIELLIGREVPTGRFPSDIGIVCQNVATALAVHQALSTGAPLVSRVVTVTGGGVAAPRNVRVRIGTMISDLIAHCGGYTDAASALIIGGSMMGIAQRTDDIPVAKGTNCVIVAGAQDAPTPGREWPCIRCGECAGACPARLLPQELLRAADSNNFSLLDTLGLDDCIECGCCDAVCPSHIALTSRFVRARRLVDRKRQADEFSADSQSRYESRTQRLAQLDEHEQESQRALLASLETEEERKAAIRAALERVARRKPNGDT